MQIAKNALQRSALDRLRDWGATQSTDPEALAKVLNSKIVLPNVGLVARLNEQRDLER